MKKILLSFLLLLPFFLSAKHIVGGEITYKFVSRSGTTTTLAMTMHIYRDCNSPGAPLLDALANITYFRKKTGDVVGTARVTLQGPYKVNKNLLPCLISPDNVCVEEGVYEWNQEYADLGDQSDGYTVVYQRCCRNPGIINIYNSDKVGATYTVDITQFALTTQNNSPTFKSFPPLLVCAGQPINFDHGATDAEGDQLVYRFCEPYAGGGQNMNLDNCSSAAPRIACFPPATKIAFVSPTYTYDTPLAGDPLVYIDPNTGIIIGNAPAQGRYVIAVCVEEYRNGKLLSILHRDFQFNVEECTKTVNADIKSDTVIKRNYIFQLCGTKDVQITNLSTIRDQIKNFAFKVKIGNDTTTFTTWEPDIVFPDTGTYKGNLFLNPGTVCSDTISLTFNVFPSTKTNFSYAYDTCVSGPVVFKDLSKSPISSIVSRRWIFGDNAESILQNPSHQYKTPGIKNIQLFTVDGKGCKSDSAAKINWVPVPALIVIQPSTFRGCTPQNIFFNNLSYPIDSTYNINWTFGDGGTSKAISPTYTYNTPGLYSVNLNITSPLGCKTSKNFPNWVTVLQGTKANFIYSPQQVNSINKTVTFTDKSTNALRWSWSVDLKPISTFQNPVYTFRDTGIQAVRLITSNQFCQDTAIQYIDVEPFVSYFLPNAFTPNDDAVNDLYKGLGHTEGMLNYSMKIWNRWGELIFLTSNPSEGWNGRKNNSGEPSPQDVYLCIVTYVTPRGVPKELRSYATLVR